MEDAIDSIVDDNIAGLPPIYLDGVQLVNPSADHHRVLGVKGRASSSPGTPEIDVVFVHGLMGDAFRTWRMRGYSPGWGFGLYPMPAAQLWPREWLQRDLPTARLLSYEYHAPMGYKWFTGEWPYDGHSCRGGTRCTGMASDPLCSFDNVLLSLHHNLST